MNKLIILPKQLVFISFLLTMCQSLCEHDLVSARNVFIFGHSLNQIDFGYFMKYFKMIESNTDTERGLAIITKDDKSIVLLLNNINKIGLSEREIRTHTKVKYAFTGYWNKNKDCKVPSTV